MKSWDEQVVDRENVARVGFRLITRSALVDGQPPVKHLIHQEFERNFTSVDDIIVPIAARFLNSRCSQLDPTHLPSSPGAALRPLVKESSEVDTLLKDRKEENQIGGYLDVHLPMCECYSGMYF